MLLSRGIGEGHVRLALVNPMEFLEEAFKRLERLVKTMRG
jgi:aspartate/methionine/tyrosine aminotransferase